MYRTIREQGDHLVQLALERDHAILELDQVKLAAVRHIQDDIFGPNKTPYQVKLDLAAIRVESEDLHAQLAKYGQVIKAYGTQHTPRPVRP